MYIHSNGLIKKINIYIFLIYIIVVNTPRFSSATLELSLAVLWIATAMPIKRFISADWKSLIAFWLIYEVILRLTGFSSAAWGNYVIHALFYFPLMAFFTYKNCLSVSERNNIVNTYLAILFINLLINLIMLSKYPRYNLLLNYTDTYNGIQLRSLNIGNTMFSYLMMLFSILCFYFCLIGRRKYAIPFIAGLVYFVLASKTTAFLLLGIGIVLVVFMQLSKSIKATQRLIVLFAALFVLIIIYKFGIPFFADLISNEAVKVRLNAIAESDYSSDYFSRIQLALLSLKSFAKHPLFGVGYELINLGKASIYEAGIGRHSEIIDLLGRYGLVGAVFNCLIFKSYYRYIKGICSSIDARRIINLLLTIILLYSFLNNTISAEIGLFMFFFLPCLADCCFEKNEMITSL